MERHPYLARIKVCEQKFNITGYFSTLPPSIHRHSRHIATLDTPPLSTYRHPRNIATKFGEQTGLALWQPDWQCFERQSEFSPWCCYCSSVALWCAPMHRHTGPASTQMKMYFVILLFGCCTYLHALLQSMFQKKKRT